MCGLVACVCVCVCDTNTPPLTKYLSTASVRFQKFNCNHNFFMQLLLLLLLFIDIAKVQNSNQCDLLFEIFATVTAAAVIATAAVVVVVVGSGSCCYNQSFRWPANACGVAGKAASKSHSYFFSFIVANGEGSTCCCCCCCCCLCKIPF